jgi:DNA-binding LytR/AlgR family response regulator
MTAQPLQASEKVNVLIVEDESIVALDLSTGLERDGYHVVGIADNAEDARELFENNDVDIILMDINIIGEKDGIETAKDLLGIKEIPVIYLTAFTDAPTIERVKKTHPAAFLTKPYNINNVRIAIDLALNNFAIMKEQQGNAKVISIDEAKTPKELRTDKETILQMNDCIFVKQNYQFIKIRLPDILYVESDNNYTNIFTAEKKITLRISLNQLLEKIIFVKLVRIHRSYAVNLQAIQSFTEQDVLVGKQELPIGRNYKDSFLKHFDFR